MKTQINISSASNSRSAPRGLLALAVLGTVGEAKPHSSTASTDAFVPDTLPTALAGSSPPLAPPFSDTQAARAQDRNPTADRLGLHHRAFIEKPNSAHARSMALEALHQPSESLTRPHSLLTDTDVHTWKEATANISDIKNGSVGVVNFSADFNCSDYDQMITITGNVTVQGNHAVCDAKGNGSFFLVKSGASLALFSMTLKNGYASKVSARLVSCAGQHPFTLALLCVYVTLHKT